MADKTKAKVSVAGFEYHGYFGDPIFDNTRFVPLLKTLFEALKPWDIRPVDVKYRNAGAANDAIAAFELPNSRIVLNLSHSGFTFTVQNADWSQAEFVTQFVEACWKAVTASLQIRAQRHELIIMMTAIPEGKTLQDITKPFAVPWRLRTTERLDMCGLILYTANGSFVVDKAAANPKAIFAKIMHRFGGVEPFSEMLRQLYDDEMWLANTLDLEFV